MTKIMLNIVVASMVLSATAGLFDSLKKAGAELVEGANGVVGGVVNASTSVVNSVTTDTTVSENGRDRATTGQTGPMVATEKAKSSGNEITDAKNSAVEYLTHDFTRQMQELMGKDKNGVRYRNSSRHFYTYVSVRKFKTRWQQVSRREYPEVPDLMPGNLPVPSSLSEVERWKQEIQAKIECEYEYWKSRERSVANSTSQGGASPVVGTNEKETQGSATVEEALQGEPETDNALAAKLKMFLENELYPQTKRFEAALQTRYNGFHDTLWRDGVLPSEGGLCPLKKEVVYDRLVEDFGDEFCKKWENEIFSRTFTQENCDPALVATRLLMEPWNDVAIHWNPTNRRDQMTYVFFTKEGRSEVGDYVKNDNPVRYLDRYGAMCEPADTEKWIEVAKGWLAKTREAIDRECFIDGRSLKWFAQAHSETNYSSFSVYKDIALGDSVGAVYSKLKAIDKDAKWTGDPGFKGKVYDKYPNGKLLQTELKTHKLMFVFGSMEEDAGSALVYAKISFKGVAPSHDEMIEKYMGLPAAKRLKDEERKEVGRKWKDDNVSNFWRLLTEFAQFQLMQSAMSGSGERGELTDKERTGQSLLADDLVVIKRDHSDGIFVDAAVVESGGATISVRTMSDTGNVVDVIIEDRIVAQAMEKKQSEFMTKKAERARLKKESAIKAQKKAAVDF